MLDALPASLLRLKGSLNLGDRPGTHLLQLVGCRWSLTPMPGPSQGGIELVGVATETGEAVAALLDTALLRAAPPILQGDLHRCA